MTGSRLTVSLGEAPIGTLEQRNGGARFLPNPSWAALPAGRRPVLGQRFEERPWTELRAGQGLPGWFEHLLPETGGPLRRAVARGAGLRETSSFAIAGLVGLDLPGAVVLRPGEAPPSTAGGRVLEEPPGDAPDLAKLRFSLAGIQLKFSARATERGLVIGYGGDRIVKLADQRFDQVPANEHAVMAWAQACGIDVPAAGLVRAGDLLELPDDLVLRDPMAFAIERFDRTPGGGRVHQEDFAQILGLSPFAGRRDKYEGTNLDSIARVVSALAAHDCDELVRRITFMVLSANGDMHAKNWSMIYPDGLWPRLAPAYDLLCTDVYLGEGRMALRLAGTDRLDAVDLDRIEQLAVRAGLDATRARAVASETVERALDSWPEARPQAPAAVADFLDAWLARCPLARTTSA